MNNFKRYSSISRLQTNSVSLGLVVSRKLHQSFVSSLLVSHGEKNEASNNRFDKNFVRTIKTRSNLDHYSVLKVSPKSTQAEIKQAYYRLSMQYHPDQHQGSEKSVAKFREITEAYEVLSNVNKRNLYDKGFHFSRVSATVEEQQEAKSAFQSRTEARRAPMTGKTAFYDFDSWYGAHYIHNIKKRETVETRKRMKKEMRRRSQETAHNTQLFILVAAILVACQGASYLIEHDTPKNDVKKE